MNTSICVVWVWRLLIWDLQTVEQWIWREIVFIALRAMEVVKTATCTCLIVSVCVHCFLSLQKILSL